jgi:hypothetical protein
MVRPCTLRNVKRFCRTALTPTLSRKRERGNVVTLQYVTVTVIVSLYVPALGVVCPGTRPYTVRL